MFDVEPIFFGAPHEFRDWLERHHATATECVVGYWKTHTGKPSLRWANAVREALCFGWIDGQSRSIAPRRVGVDAVRGESTLPHTMERGFEDLGALSVNLA